jgi:dienelactone hydrolase
LKQRVHKDVQVLTVGSGVDRAYVFIPKQPLAKGAPLVLFHHGWLGMNPKNFGGLIDLMVRRGAVVIYPVYQEGDRTAPQQVTENAAKADVAALTLLKKRYPRLVNTKHTLYFGFSMGASISLNFAMDPKRYGVPAPRALLLVAPGDAHHVAHGALAASIVDSSGSLPVDLPTVLVSGADDGIGVPTSRAIAARLCHLPADRRTLILFPSDAEGTTRIQAGHGSPGSPDSRYDFHDPFAQVPGTIPARSGFEPSGSLNLLDYYGYWRVSTRLLDWVAGKSKYPAELFSNSLENRFLGTWPSGRAYTPAIVEDHCSR